MSQAVSAADEPRHWRHLGWVMAGVGMACALGFALVCMDFASPATNEPDCLASAPASMDLETPTDTVASDAFTSSLGDTTPPGLPFLARPLPREPFKGQKRPPCTRYTEVELVGACWMPHKLKAPCPDALFEHQGECYAPTFSAKPPPQSVGQ